LSGCAEDPKKPALLDPDTNLAHRADTCPARRQCSEIGREGACLFKRNGTYHLTAEGAMRGPAGWQVAAWTVTKP
jgi:hypothetical protein